MCGLNCINNQTKVRLTNLHSQVVVKLVKDHFPLFLQQFLLSLGSISRIWASFQVVIKNYFNNGNKMQQQQQHHQSTLLFRFTFQFSKWGKDFHSNCSRGSQLNLIQFNLLYSLFYPSQLRFWQFLSMWFMPGYVRTKKDQKRLVKCKLSQKGSLHLTLDNWIQLK